MIRQKLQRLTDLSLRDWLWLPPLVLSALAIAMAVKLAPLPDIIRFLDRSARHPWIAFLQIGNRLHDLDELVRLTGLAARVVQGPGCCLSRSLLRFWLLRARQEPAELLIGVAKNGDLLQSHAWIEQQGLAIDAGHELNRTFVPVLRF
ncbi:MAG: lasso peptide biosynthesis B2 protein [Nitrospirae bacterium]|nr:lasso peptide biosynthesis B2 protein [Nitrospirota bacterium]